MIIVLLLLAGAYVGWNIGSNDAANCMGTAVGSGIITYRKAVWLVAISVFLGTVLQGQYVMKALGERIVRAELPLEALLIAMLSAGVFVTVATYFHMPVSTSQAIIGGLIGSGLASFGPNLEILNVPKLTAIFAGWLVGPFLAMAGAFLIYKTTRIIVEGVSGFVSGKILHKVLTFLVIFSACYAGYSLGANNAGNAFGPVLNLYPGFVGICVIMGGLSLAIGALTFGKRVTKTISKDLMPLDLVSAFSAQFSCALVVHMFALLALPISTSQGIVGSIIGIGLVHGVRTISRKTVIQIMLSWVLVPLGTGALSYWGTWLFG